MLPPLSLTSPQQYQAFSLQTTPQDTALTQWLQQNGFSASQIKSLSPEQKNAYLQQMQSLPGNMNGFGTNANGLFNASLGNPVTGVQGLSFNLPGVNGMGGFGTSNTVNGLVTAANGNPLQAVQAMGLSLPNANAASMGAGGFGKVNAAGASIIAQIMQAGAAIDPAGTMALAQKIGNNPNWGLNNNPLYQQTLSQIAPYLQAPQNFG